MPKYREKDIIIGSDNKIFIIKKHLNSNINHPGSQFKACLSCCFYKKNDCTNIRETNLKDESSCEELIGLIGLYFDEFKGGL